MRQVVTQISCGKMCLWIQNYYIHAYKHSFVISFVPSHKPLHKGNISKLYVSKHISNNFSYRPGPHFRNQYS